MKFDSKAYDELFPREKPKKAVESTVEDFSDEEEDEDTGISEDEDTEEPEQEE